MQSSSRRVEVSAVIEIRDPSPETMDCLHSVLDQTLLELELIAVIRDQDVAAKRVISQYARSDGRVRVVRAEQDTGARSALAIGLAHASGGYVTFPTNDGMVANGAYERMAASLEASGSDVVTGPVEAFGARRGRTANADALAEISMLHVSVASAPSLVADDVIAAKMYRRDFLTRNDITFRGFGTEAKLLFVLEAFCRADQVDVLDTPVFWQREPHRVQPAPLTTTWAQMCETAVEMLGTSTGHIKSAFAESLLKRALAETEATETTGQSGDDTRVARVVQHLLALVRPVFFGIQAIDDRWVLALWSVGAFDAAGVVRQQNAVPPNDVGVREQGVPEELRRMLGLDGSSLSRAFRATFLAEQASLTTQQTADDGSRPEISVIVPTFNVEAYVDDLLASLRAVQGVNLEIIVVDDGSTDQTWSIADSHRAADSRVELFRSPGAGGGEARNYGVSVATGEFLAFADGDDLVPPRAYRDMLDAARETNAEIVTTSYIKFFRTSSWNAVEGYRGAYHRRVDAVTLADHPQLARHRACWNRLIRRDFWEENALPFPSVPRANDVVPMMSVLTAAKRISVRPRVGYVYRDRPGAGSMTSAVGSVPYTISYLVEERTAACLLHHIGDAALEREYWSMVLETDGWGTLKAYLAARNRGPDDDENTVTAHVSRLLELMPDEVFNSLSPDHQALWLLARHGEWEAARTLYAAWSSERPQVRRVIDAVEKLSAIAATTKRCLAWCAWKYLLRRVIDDPSERTFDTFDAIAQSLRHLASARGISLAVLPTAWENRVYNALMSDTLSAAEAFSPLRVVDLLLKVTPSGAWIEGDVLPDVQPKSVVLVDRKDDIVRRHLALAEPSRARSGAWRAKIDLALVPTGTEWEMRLEVMDRWRTRRLVTVHLNVRVGARFAAGISTKIAALVGRQPALTMRSLQSAVSRVIRRVRR